METEISLPKGILNVQELTNQARQVQRASWRQRMETMLREIFEGHEEFLGLTPE